jgi:Flp pilus assembly pilin Flp
MNYLNPLNDPNIDYLLVFVRTRIDRARAEDASRGASAIEWAIITGILAIIAIAVGKLIYDKVTTSAQNIKTDPGIGG